MSTPVEKDEPNFARIEPYVEAVLDQLLHDCDLPLINVNFPPAPKGIRWTRQAVRHYDGHIVPGTDPMGREHFWFTVSPIEQVEEGTDLWAMGHDWVSMTPLRLDLTDHDALAQAQDAESLDREVAEAQ